MTLSRETTLRIRNFLDNWLPPVIRDSRFLMIPLLRLALGPKFRIFAQFKESGFQLTPEQFSGVYQDLADASKIQGATDLNLLSVEAILDGTLGPAVLDVGCGRGFLAERLNRSFERVTGCDIVLDEDLPETPGLRFVQGSVEDLPFADNEFDTVVCTHTLEHVQRIDAALEELRRVAKRRLIIVVPRERPYRFSFNLHLHFFPYPWSWQAVAGFVPGSQLRDLGDWFYVEDL